MSSLLVRVSEINGEMYLIRSYHSFQRLKRSSEVSEAVGCRESRA